MIPGSGNAQLAGNRLRPIAEPIVDDRDTLSSRQAKGKTA
jgi:hypothetical protein